MDAALRSLSTLPLVKYPPVLGDDDLWVGEWVGEEAEDA